MQQQPPGYPPQGYPPQPPAKAPWYHSSVIIGVSLFFCAPVGLILLWTSKATSATVKVLGTVVFGGLFLLVLAGQSGAKKPTPSYQPPATPAALATPREVTEQPAVAATAEPVTESCLALATKFGTESKLSDLQKDELWKSYDGKSFAWDLKITEVSAGLLSGFTVQAKCAPRSSSLIQDIQLSYEKEAKSFVMGLQKDGTYKLSGVLKSQSSLLGLSADGTP